MRAAAAAAWELAVESGGCPAPTCGWAWDGARVLEPCWGVDQSMVLHHGPAAL